MTALLLATRNAHKAREIQQVLAGDYQYFTLLDFPAAPEAVEDGATFAANAAKKVSILADWLAATPQSWVVGRALRARRGGQRSARPTFPEPAKTDRSRLAANSPLLPAKFTLSDSPFYVVADDSGLEVDVLGGAPGAWPRNKAAE